MVLGSDYVVFLFSVRLSLFVSVMLWLLCIFDFVILMNWVWKFGGVLGFDNIVLFQ